MPEVAVRRGPPPLRHVEPKRQRQPFGMTETLGVGAFVPLLDRIDRASGAMGQKIEPRGGILREKPIPQALGGVWQLPHPDLVPFGKSDGGGADLNALGAVRKRSAVEDPLSSCFFEAFTSIIASLFLNSANGRAVDIAGRRRFWVIEAL